MSFFRGFPEPFRTVISESAIRLDHAEQYGLTNGWAALSEEAGLAVEVLTSALQKLKKIRQPERYPFRQNFSDEELWAVQDALLPVINSNFVFLKSLNHQTIMTSNFIHYMHKNRCPECSEGYEYAIRYLPIHLEALKALNQAAAILRDTPSSNR